MIPIRKNPEMTVICHYWGDKDGITERVQPKIEKHLSEVLRILEASEIAVYPIVGSVLQFPIQIGCFPIKYDCKQQSNPKSSI